MPWSCRNVCIRSIIIEKIDLFFDEVMPLSVFYGHSIVICVCTVETRAKPGIQLVLLKYTSRVPVEGKSSVCLICMKYRIIILIIIIINLGQILLSFIANTSRTHALIHARTHAYTRTHARTRTRTRIRTRAHTRTRTHTAVSVPVRCVGGAQA